MQARRCRLVRVEDDLCCLGGKVNFKYGTTIQTLLWPWEILVSFSFDQMKYKKAYCKGSA
jgi:hypothetical protein